MQENRPLFCLQGEVILFRIPWALYCFVLFDCECVLQDVSNLEKSSIIKLRLPGRQQEATRVVLYKCCATMSSIVKDPVGQEQQ